MKFSTAELQDERGQGLMEYTLIVFLVTLVFWGGMKGPISALTWQQASPKW